MRSMVIRKILVFGVLTALSPLSIGQTTHSVKVPHEFEEGVKIIKQKNLDLQEVQRGFDQQLTRLSEEMSAIDSCIATENEPQKVEVYNVAKEVKRSEALKAVSDYLDQILSIRSDMEGALSLIYRGVLKSANAYDGKKYIGYINEIQERNFRTMQKMYNASMLKANQINDPIITQALDKILIGLSNLSVEYKKQQTSYMQMSTQVQKGASALSMVRDQVELAKSMFTTVTELVVAQKNYLRQFTEIKASSIALRTTWDELRKFFDRLKQIQAGGVPDIPEILDDLYAEYDYELDLDLNYGDPIGYDKFQIELDSDGVSADEVANSVLANGRPTKPKMLEGSDVGF